MNRPTLRLYSRRPEATDELIALLARRGYTIDARANGARVGTSIVNAVKRFQAQNLRTDGAPLTVDGVVGPQTWAVLERPVYDEQRLGMGRGETPRIPIVSGIPEPGELLERALHQYDNGVRERPVGSNRVPELEPRAQGRPWCSFWVHDRIRRVTGTWIFGGRRGSTRVDLRMARERGLLLGVDGCPGERPGDVWILCDEDGRPYHTGIVLRVGAIAIDTVEGNCANRVAIRRRRVTGMQFWRPFPGELEWVPGLLPGDVKSAGGESTR